LIILSPETFETSIVPTIRYTYHTEQKNWTDANAACQHAGGTLAVEYSKQIHKDIIRKFASDEVDQFWIGVFNTGEKTWKAVTGEDIPNKNNVTIPGGLPSFWAIGEPGNGRRTKRELMFSVLQSVSNETTQSMLLVWLQWTIND
jgi:hypothetical protein